MDKKLADILACIIQFVLCTGGGFWAGYQAEPDSVGTSGAGALSMGLALFLSYGAAHSVGLAVGSFQFLRQLAQRRSDGDAGHAARSASDDQRLRGLISIVAAAALLALSLVAALAIWAVSAQGDLSDTVLRCLLIGCGASLLMSRALRCVFW